MKFHKGKSNPIVSTIIVLAILFIGALINSAISVTNKAVIDATLSEMDEVGTQIEIMVEDTLRHGKEDMSRLAQYVASDGVATQDIVDYLRTQSQSEAFKVLYFVDINGNGTSVDNDVKDFSDHEAYINALNNKFTSNQPRVSTETDEIIFDITVPIIRNGEMIGFLYSESSLGDFFETMDSNTDGTGDMFITDHSLNLLFSTSENHSNAATIPTDEIEEMGANNIAQAQSDFINGNSGGFHYDFFGTEKIMVYYPIEFTEWVFAMNVEVGALSNELTFAIGYFKSVSQISFWIIVVLLVYIAFFQHRSNKNLIKTAYFDTLTQLPNMTKLKLEMRFALEKHSNRSYSIIVFDVVNFKAINEMFGYEVGDNVLKSIKLFASLMNENSLITARIGTDKFAMFAESQFLSDVDRLNEKVTEVICENIPEIADYSCSFKIGRYIIEEGETDVDEILGKVNLAHIRAKRTKGQKLCDYDDEFRQKVLSEAEITNNMKSALDNHEFKVYLQPKFSTNEDDLVGAEALVRWVGTNGKVVMPNDFIPLFERNGFVVEIDKYILENVCKTIRHWLDMGLGQFTVSVNCSRLNLSNPFYVDGLIAIVDKYNVPHECIEIELTESVTIINENTIEKLFTDLHNNGFKISIDDFGAGYSSLGMLKNLHVDTLKMDRSFFVGGKNARRDDMLIDSIVKLSHNLGMYVVAEGIETYEQIELLRTMNCDAIQGYVHAKPMPVMEFEEKYKHLMLKNLSGDKQTPLITNINDVKFANSFVPCGIVIVELDDDFTIVEANQGFFDLTGFTREEIRDYFNNFGRKLLLEEDAIRIEKYIDNKLAQDPEGQLHFVGKMINKDQNYITIQMNGRFAVNEIGRDRLYFSIMDITKYSESARKLKNEVEFNALIASLTNNAFFDYDKESDTIHFSQNFADKFKIPNIIENFKDSEIGKKLFSIETSGFGNNNNSISRKSDGEVCLTLPNGDPIWYLYNYNTIQIENTNNYKVVGKLTEAAGHKAEMDILKVKSQTDPMSCIFNKNATDRYIRNYLRIATEGNENGAFFVISLENFDKIQADFGQEYVDMCLSDVSAELRSMFRSIDLIGRAKDGNFFVFINNCPAMEFVEKKAIELSVHLSKTYEKDGEYISLIAKVGISFYPVDGDSFASLYGKACEKIL